VADDLDALLNKLVPELIRHGAATVEAELERLEQSETLWLLDKQLVDVRNAEERADGAALGLLEEAKDVGRRERHRRGREEENGLERAELYGEEGIRIRGKEV
jgi:hypothetical protein